MHYDSTDWDALSVLLGKKESDILYLLLASPHLQDEVVALHIKEEPNSGKYRRYKRGLKKRLYEQFLKYPISSSNHSGFQKNYYETNKQLAILGVLKGLSLNHLAKPMADALIIKSRKYFLNEVRLDVCRYFVKYHTVIEIDLKKASAFYQEAQHCLFLLSKEGEIQWNYAQLVASRIKAKVDMEYLHDMGVRFVGESEPLLSEMSESYKYHQNFFALSYLTYEIIGDYKSALHYAKTGLEYFKELSFTHYNAESSQLMKMARCYLYLNELEKGKEALTTAMQKHRVGSMNWYVCGYQKVMIDIHLKDYDKAYTYHKNMVSQRSFKNQSEEVRSFNILIGGYLEFLMRVGLIESEHEVAKFRIKKLVNEMSHFESDKERMKIPLIVIQLLFSIYERDYDGMEQKIYVLKDYCSRNLVRKSPNFRSNCFIKMLLEVPINNFNAIAVRRKTERYLDRMKSVTYNIAAPLAGVEVIPYEHLWSIILDHLQSPKRKRKSALSKTKFIIK